MYYTALVFSVPLMRWYNFMIKAFPRICRISPCFKNEEVRKKYFLDMDDNDDADVLYQSVKEFSSAR